MNAEARSTDFSNLEEVSSKYKALKGAGGQEGATGDSSPVPPATPALPLPPAQKPPKGLERPSRRQRAERRRQQEPERAPIPAMNLEEQKDMERFKLRVWMAKLIMSVMTVIVFVILAVYVYTAYVTKSAPDMGLFGTIFGHLKEVLVVVIEAQK